MYTRDALQLLASMIQDDEDLRAAAGVVAAVNSAGFHGPRRLGCYVKSQLNLGRRILICFLLVKLVARSIETVLQLIRWSTSLLLLFVLTFLSAYMQDDSPLLLNVGIAMQGHGNVHCNSMRLFGSSLGEAAQHRRGQRRLAFYGRRSSKNFRRPFADVFFQHAGFQQEREGAEKGRQSSLKAGARTHARVIVSFTLASA